MDSYKNPMDQMVVGVEEFEIEELKKLTLTDATQVLRNTFDDADVTYDDESTQNNGWRIRLNHEAEYGLTGDEEDKIETLLSKIGGPNLFTLSTEAATATGHTNELGQCTNLYYYFFMEDKAYDHLEEIRKRVYTIEVKENEG